MLVTVRIKKAQGGNFKMDKNGNMPYLCLDLQTGKIISFGGIINGSVGNKLGLVENGIYTLNISSTQTTVGANTYTNYNHDVIADLTQSVYTEGAKLVAASLFGTQQSSRPTQNNSMPKADEFIDEVIPEVVGEEVGEEVMAGDVADSSIPF